MNCTLEGCCYLNGDSLGALVCAGYTDEEIQKELEQREIQLCIPYYETQENRHGGTTTFKQDTTHMGYIKYGTCLVARFFSNPELYINRLLD